MCAPGHGEIADAGRGNPFERHGSSDDLAALIRLTFEELERDLQVRIGMLDGPEVAPLPNAMDVHFLAQLAPPPMGPSVISP